MHEQRGRLLAGRQILWMLYKQFRTNEDMGEIFNIVDLTKMRWQGDARIEQFRSSLGTYGG